MSEIQISKHAEKRIRKRMGVNRSAVSSVVSDALERGIGSGQCSGSLRRYLDKIYFGPGSADKGIVYQDHIFLLKRNILVSVIPAPKKYKGTISSHTRARAG